MFLPAAAATIFENYQYYRGRVAKMKGITPDQVRDGISGQTLLGRWAEPQEIGDAAAWIVSEKNSYQTGTVVEVCGGFAKYI